MDRLRKLRPSFHALGYYYTRRIAPNAAHPTASTFINCKLHLPLLHQVPFRSLSKPRGSPSSPLFRSISFPKSAKQKLKRLFSRLLELIAALVIVPLDFLGFLVVFLGILYFHHVKTVPYTNRRRFRFISDSRDSMLGCKMLEKKKADNTLGEILPAIDPRSVKVCLSLRKLLDALHRDLGLEESPIVTLHGDGAVIAIDPHSVKVCLVFRRLLDALHRDSWLEDSPIVTLRGDETVVLSNRSEITDKSFEENGATVEGGRTEIGHLKGLNWQVVVVDKNEEEAYTFGGGIIVVSSGLLDRHSDLEIAAVLAHEVAHCVARHVVEWRYVAFDSAGFNLSDNVGLVKFHQRDEKEANHIALQLMESAGYDPHVLGNLEISSKYEENGPISLQERIQLLEKLQTTF